MEISHWFMSLCHANMEIKLWFSCRTKLEQRLLGSKATTLQQRSEIKKILNSFFLLSSSRDIKWRQSSGKWRNFPFHRRRRLMWQKELRNWLFETWTKLTFHSVIRSMKAPLTKDGHLHNSPEIPVKADGGGKCVNPRDDLIFWTRGVAVITGVLFHHYCQPTS